MRFWRGQLCKMFKVISEIVILPCHEHNFWMIGFNYPWPSGTKFYPIATADTKEELIEARDMILDGIDNLMRLEGIITTPKMPSVVEKFLEELDEKDKEK